LPCRRGGSGGSARSLIILLLNHNVAGQRDLSQKGEVVSGAEMWAPHDDMKLADEEIPEMAVGTQVQARRPEVFYVPGGSPKGATSATALPTVDGIAQEGFIDVRDVLKNHFMFSGPLKNQVDALAGQMDLLVFNARDTVIREGEQGDCLFVVDSGSLTVYRSTQGNEMSEILSPGAVFGELSVLYNAPRGATVVARSDNVRLWRLRRSAIRKVESEMATNDEISRTEYLRKIPEFEKFNDEQLRRLAGLMEEEHFEPGEIICKEGEQIVKDINDKFYTIASGKVNVSVCVDHSNKGELWKGTQEVVASLEAGKWFGEMALLHDDPRSASVRAAENTICYTLKKAAFVSIVKELSGVLNKSNRNKEDNNETVFKFERQELASRLYGFKALKVHHVIGEGAFSVVRLVTLRDDPDRNYAFALKTMNKQDLRDRKQVVHVNNERAILQQTTHPFILSLVKTFQTTNHIYMLFELVQGGELFSLVVDSKGGLPNQRVKFYTACVAEGLSYLHRKNIAYRDLKLENLVISADGYVKIIDFGFAKQLADKETTRTLCGTPDYLAPEAVARQGHNHAVDCWSLGVIIFEMLTQYSPFADTSGNNNQMTVFKNILKGIEAVDWGKLRRRFAPDDIQEFDLVRSTLCKLWAIDVKKRLTVSKLKEWDEQSQSYFHDVSFTRLREKLVAPPWVPEVKSYDDTSYFDTASFVHVRESCNEFAGDQASFADF